MHVTNKVIALLIIPFAVACANMEDVSTMEEVNLAPVNGRIISARLEYHNDSQLIMNLYNNSAFDRDAVKSITRDYKRIVSGEELFDPSSDRVVHLKMLYGRLQASASGVTETRAKAYNNYVLETASGREIYRKRCETEGVAVSFKHGFTTDDLKNVAQRNAAMVNFACIRKHLIEDSAEINKRLTLAEE